MRILSILLAAFMSIVTSHAHAWSLWEMNGAKMDIDGKDVRVASVNTVGGDHIFHSNDKEFENGVYVVATLNASSRQILPLSTALIRDYLHSRGLNATDKPDGCALGIRFEVYDLSIDGSPTSLNPQSNGQAKALGIVNQSSPIPRKDDLFRMGKQSELGVAVDKNHDLAMYYYCHAAIEGSPEAYERLGISTNAEDVEHYLKLMADSWYNRIDPKDRPDISK